MILAPLLLRRGLAISKILSQCNKSKGIEALNVTHQKGLNALNWNEEILKEHEKFAEQNAYPSQTTTRSNTNFSKSSFDLSPDSNLRKLLFWSFIVLLGQTAYSHVRAMVGSNFFLLH